MRSAGPPATARLDPSTLPFSRGVDGPDVGVLNALGEQVPVEAGLELGSVVGLNLHNAEWQLLEDVVDESDRGLLIQALVDPKHTQSSAVIDSRVLVVLLALSFDGLDELDVDLQLSWPNDRYQVRTAYRAATACPWASITAPPTSGFSISTMPAPEATAELAGARTNCSSPSFMRPGARRGTWSGAVSDACPLPYNRVTASSASKR